MGFGWINWIGTWFGAGLETCTGGTRALGGSSAERPLPSALRCLSVPVFILQDLLCELDVAFSSAGPRVVHQDGFSVTGGFRQADAAGNDGRENLIAEEILQIVGDLASQIRSIIEHSQ